jgi:hypothetical protein
MWPGRPYRHLDIEQHHIWLYVLSTFSSCMPFSRLSYHLHVLTHGKRRFDAGTKQGMVVGDRYFDDISVKIFHIGCLIEVRLFISGNAKCKKAAIITIVFLRDLNALDSKGALLLHFAQKIGT